MLDFFNKSVTLYNDIQINGERVFTRRVIDKCSIQGGMVERNQGTIRDVVTGKKVITKDIKRYVSPVSFRNLPNEYTLQPGDYIVLDVVNDEVNSAKDFSALQKKYTENGIKVVSVNVRIHGTITDNISILNI